MIGSERRRLLLGGLVLAILTVFVVRELRVTSDITHFLPGGQLGRDVELARELAAGELSRTMVVLLDAPDEETARAASRAFEQTLLDEPSVATRIAFLEAGPPTGVEEALWALYHPRRLAFLEGAADAPRERLDQDALDDAVARLKQRLALPISSLVSRVAPGDPLLILPDLFEALAGSRAERLVVSGDRFLTQDRRSAVLFLGTHGASFDSTTQGPFLQDLEAAFEFVDDQFDGALGLRLSAAARFAVRAEEAIRADIRRVSIGSMVGLLLLILIVFRSLRLVVSTLPVLAAGFLSGTAACLALFGEVHGLTLAFGAALIGVSIDYTVHVHCHQVLAPDPGGPRRTLDRIWIGLALGAATTVVGFVFLLVSTFPGLRELAVFAACGITAALWATRVFLPGLLSRTGEPTAAALATAATTQRLLGGLDRHRALLVVGVLLVAAVSVIGITRARWNDDIADLNQLDPELLREDTAVREAVASYEQRRLVVSVGAVEQAALEVNDRVGDLLREAQEAGEIGGFRSLARMLPSAARQRASATAFADDPALWDRLVNALESDGFRAEAFQPFREALAEPAPPPLDWEDLAASPLHALVRSFKVTWDGGVGFVSFLHGVADPDALDARLATVDGASLIDIRGTLSRAYGAYRERMMWLLLLGFAAVIGLVALRHRDLRATVAACAPALLAAAATVATLGFLDVELNMLSLVALLMVVSMGVDYGVFLAETTDDTRELDATLLAVFVSALSTILGFGLLALSDHPALFSIGMTSGIGIFLCLLLAPTVRLLVSDRGRHA